MHVSQFPNEILNLFANLLDIPSLRKLRTLNRQWYAVASRALYTNAAYWDGVEYEAPICLSLAAIRGHLGEFQQLLDHTCTKFFAACNIRLVADHPVIESWARQVISRRTESRRQRTTLLHLLCQLGRDEMVRLVLARYATENGKNDRGYPTDEQTLYAWNMATPVQCAASKGHITTVKILLDAGALASEPVRSENGYTVLSAAVKGGHAEVVQLLLQHGADLYPPPGENIPILNPFTFACRIGRTDIIDILLAAKCGTEEQVQMAINIALADIASGDTRTPIARHLINAGAEISQEVLVTAAHFGAGDMLRLLISNGGRFSTTINGAPNQILHNGGCPPSIARFVLEQEPAFLNLPDTMGETPLDGVYGSQPFHGEEVEQFVLFLIGAGAIVTSSRTLCKAAYYGHETAVRELLRLESQKPFISLPNIEGMPALLQACQSSSAPSQNIVAMLIDAGADVHSREPWADEAALQFATQAGASRSVRKLIEAGADINYLTPRGTSYIKRAIQGGSVEVLRTLLDAGVVLSQTDNIGPYSLLHEVVDTGLRVCRTTEFANAAPSILLTRNPTLPETIVTDSEQSGNGVAQQLDFLRHLVGAGADVSVQDKYGYTPLDHILFHRLRGQFDPLQTHDEMNMNAVGATRRAQESFQRCVKADHDTKEEEEEDYGLIGLF